MLELKIPKEYFLTLQQVKEKKLQYLTVVNLAKVDYQQEQPKLIPAKTQIHFLDSEGTPFSSINETFYPNVFHSNGFIPYAEIIFSKVKVADLENADVITVKIGSHGLPQQVRGRHGKHLIQIPVECILGNVDFLSYYHSGLIGIFNPDYLAELYADSIARALIYQNHHPDGRWSKLPDWLQTSKTFWYDGTQFQILETQTEIEGYTWIPDRKIRQPWESPDLLKKNINNTITYRIRYLLKEDTPQSLIALLQYFLYDKSSFKILSENNLYIKELDRTGSAFITDIDTLIEIIPNWSGYLYQIHQEDITHLSEDSFRRNDKWLFSCMVTISKSLDYQTFIKNLKHYLALWVANDEQYIQVLSE